MRHVSSHVYLVISGDIICLPGLLALVADESPPLVLAGCGGGEPNAWYKILCYNVVIVVTVVIVVIKIIVVTVVILAIVVIVVIAVIVVIVVTVVIVAIVAIVAIVVIEVIVTTVLQCSQDAEIKMSLTD